VIRYLKQTKTLGFSFLVIFPLVLLYESAIVRYDVGAPDFRNAAEKILKDALAQVGLANPWLQLGLYLLISSGVLVYSRRNEDFRLPPLRYWGIFFIESLFYATVLGIATRSLIRLPLLLQHNAGTGSATLVPQFLLAIAAGIYEEFLFRLLILGSLLWLFQRLWHGRLVIHAVIASAVAASVFAIFHYPSIDVVDWYSFVFRLIAGWLLGLIFVYRGLGCAVYTHAMYDVLFILKTIL